MQKSLLGFATAAALIVTPAIAADLPLKAPQVAVPAYSWAGCHVGINGGYDRINISRTYIDPNAAPDPINGVPNGFGFATLPTSTGGGGSGGIGGIGGGCNWESPQRIVFGIEADFDAANIRLDQTAPGAIGVSYQTGAGGANTFAANFAGVNESIRENWLSTIRGRIGYAVQDRLLLFATGGLAIGEVRSQGSVLLGQNGQIPAGTYPLWSGSSETVRAGVTIGAGAEWAFSDHWTSKVEYLWYDLGHVSHPLNCATPAAGFCNGTFFTRHWAMSFLPCKEASCASDSITNSSESVG